MKKIDRSKINRSNTDIWAALNEAVKTKNLAVIVKNIERLRALQKHYIDLLNFQDMEITILKDSLAHAEKTISEFEKEWLEEIAKRNGAYERLKQRIEEGFRP